MATATAPFHHNWPYPFGSKGNKKAQEALPRLAPFSSSPTTCATPIQSNHNAKPSLITQATLPSAVSDLDGDATSTVTGSWTNSLVVTSGPTTTQQDNNGVDVPPLLQSFLGVDFLPFPLLEEEDTEDEPISASQQQQIVDGVPRDVHVASSNSRQRRQQHSHDVSQQGHQSAPQLSIDTYSDLKNPAPSSPTKSTSPLKLVANPEDTRELQELLLENKKRGMKKSVKAVFHKLKKSKSNKQIKHDDSSSVASASVNSTSSKSSHKRFSLKMGKKKGGGSTASINNNKKRLSLFSSRPPRPEKSSGISPVSALSSTTFSLDSDSPQHATAKTLQLAHQSFLEQLEALCRESQLEHDEQQHMMDVMQAALEASHGTVQEHLDILQHTQQRLQDLVSRLSQASGAVESSLHAIRSVQQQGLSAPPQRLRAHTDPGMLDASLNADVNNISSINNSKTFRRSESGSFMRVHDLDLDEDDAYGDAPYSSSMSSLSNAAMSLPSPRTLQNGGKKSIPKNDHDFLCFLDHQFLRIANKLFQLGYDLATDESERFAPTKDTEKLLKLRRSHGNAVPLENWPIHPWHAAYDDDVLVWTRTGVQGFGKGFPVMKTRGLLNTSARNMLDVLWDSTRCSLYNKVNKGRQDVHVVQEGVHTTAAESEFGLDGACKIIKSLNKHRLVPTTVEMQGMMYARSLDYVGAPGSYMIVTRSVWENDCAEAPQPVPGVVRSELLLGVTLLRAVSSNVCEMTSITHMLSPGVPEYLVRKLSPGQAVGAIQNMQAVFLPGGPEHKNN